MPGTATAASSATTLPPFQAVIDAHAVSVARFLRGMVGAQAAEDALQETFLAALRAYPRFDGANPRAWLLTIARNKAIDAVRAAKRRPEPLADPDQVAADPGGARQEGTTLWAAVETLPPKQRAAIVLRFAVDLRYREVGAAMGCSEEAARRSVHEGLKSLRKSDAIEEVRA